MTLYYSVRLDRKSWTKEAVGVDFFERRGAVVKPSRSDVGNMDVFIDGRLAAKLFRSKLAASIYALGKGA